MRIIIADDHDLVRDTLASYLRSEGIIEVACVSSVSEVDEHLKAGEEFDLVVLDYKMPGMDGLKGLKLLKSLYPNIRLAVLSGNATPDVIAASLREGSVGFIPKTLSAEDLVAAVRKMADGEAFFPDFPPEKSMAALAEPLTARESQVLEGLSVGHSNKEIARDLDLQEVTIKLHVKTLCRKLDAKNRTQAAMIARDLGIL